jgi:hypothetical protein
MLVTNLLYHQRFGDQKFLVTNPVAIKKFDCLMYGNQEWVLVTTRRLDFWMVTKTLFGCHKINYQKNLSLKV